MFLVISVNLYLTRGHYISVTFPAACDKLVHERVKDFGLHPNMVIKAGEMPRNYLI